MKKISFRSPELTPEYFSTLGVIHDHFDGTGDPDRISTALLQPLSKKGNWSKINYVEEFIAGPERALLPLVYQSHTPKIAGEETIDFFTTTSHNDRADVVNFLNSLLFANFTRHAVGMIECEQVIGVLKHGQEEWLPNKKRIAIIRPEEVNLIPSRTLSNEIHWGFNISKNMFRLSLNHLGEYLTMHKVMFGGLFLFDRGDSWGIRSNAFHDEKGLRERVLKEQKVFQTFLKSEGITAELRGVIEKIICVYNWSH